MNKYTLLLLFSFSSFIAMDKPIIKYNQQANDKLKSILDSVWEFTCYDSQNSVDSKKAFLKGVFGQAKDLILSGADPNICSVGKYPLDLTLLQYFLELNMVEEAEELINIGSDPSLILGSWSPLTIAVRNNAQACVELLVKRRADINKETGIGTPICVAVRCGFASLIEYLLQSGADMHANGKWGSAWVRAAICNPEGFKLLLRYNTQINTNISANIAALHGAASSVNGRHDEMCSIAELLLAYGTPVNGRNRDGESALSRAIFWSGKIKIIKLLLSYGADVNNSTNDQITPLMKAAVHNDFAEIVRELLDHGADQSMVNKDGKRAIDIAREHNNLEIVSLLQMQKIP